MPDPNLTNATLRDLLSLAEKVRTAKPRSATSYISVLSPDMAAAILRELLETRKALAHVIEVTESLAVGTDAAAILREARAVMERERRS